ncbi:MAG: hypothetical protein JXQ83_12740 [Candidatus Glassbacteria bacterium]|nr:hypothetical protein [Candidatus Glassbacteria bacterium]
MDAARAEQVIQSFQQITRIIHTGEVGELKPSATLLEKNIKPSEMPFIRKDASGRALFYIVEGKAGVDIGQPERVVVSRKSTVGEMSLVSTMLNTFDNLGAIDSRNADVYCEEPLRVIVFNYSPVVEILQDPNPEFRRYRQQILVCLNRIIFKKLITVDKNYIDVLTSMDLENEVEQLEYPSRFVENLNVFLKKMRNIPNMRISPHDIRGVLIRENQANDSLIFLEKGMVKISKTVVVGDEEESEERERVDLSIMAAPVVVGDCSILNVGAISSNQIEVIENGTGYRIAVQNLLRHFQRYPEMLENLFKIILELNYFRTSDMMARTVNL